MDPMNKVLPNYFFFNLDPLCFRTWGCKNIALNLMINNLPHFLMIKQPWYCVNSFLNKVLLVHNVIVSLQKKQLIYYLKTAMTHFSLSKTRLKLVELGMCWIYFELLRGDDRRMYGKLNRSESNVCTGKTFLNL
ncbi:hypothetical protein GCM10027284_40080 [Cyclobacterium sediminis]